jgi:hypothetical protein
LCHRSVEYPLAVRVEVSQDSVEVHLAVWEKVFGLLGNITVSRSEIADVQVIEDPLHEVMRAGLKAGLRIPWLYYVCRTIRLDQAWIVRRGVPALAFGVRGHRALKRVIVSTPEAHELAGRLRCSEDAPPVL